jgi:tetratricopeptide (TPR) repeat protein
MWAVNSPLGICLDNARDYDSAINALYTLLNANNRHWEAWQLAGNCLYAKGDRQGALAAHKNSLTVNPDNPSLKSWMESIPAK